MITPCGGPGQGGSVIDMPKSEHPSTTLHDLLMRLDREHARLDREDQLSADRRLTERLARLLSTRGQVGSPSN
jgi:hypothetical protein